MDLEEYMIDLESRTRKVRKEFTHQNGDQRDATLTESARGMESIREENNNTSSQHSMRSEVSFPTPISSSATNVAYFQREFSWMAYFLGLIWVEYSIEFCFARHSEVQCLEIFDTGRRS